MWYRPRHNRRRVLVTAALLALSAGLGCGQTAESRDEQATGDDAGWQIDAGPESGDDGGARPSHDAGDAGLPDETSDTGGQETGDALADTRDVSGGGPPTIRCATEESYRGDSIDPLTYRLEVTGTGETRTGTIELGTMHAYRGQERSTHRMLHDGEIFVTRREGILRLRGRQRTFEVEPTNVDGVYAGELFVPDGVGLEATCWETDFTPTYTYDAESGECRDGDGEQGLNEVGLITVRETGRGECADLEGIYVNAEDLGYPVLEGWDLRGANLQDGELRFAHLVDADLRGADLGGLGYGYATITGAVDEYTSLPEAGCERSGGEVECVR